MFHDLAGQLAALHAGGYVHRDLKPDNALWMLQSQEWKLIDFGIAAAIGALPGGLSSLKPCNQALPVRLSSQSACVYEAATFQGGCAQATNNCKLHLGGRTFPGDLHAL
jgi:serine/threonine protein kinase